MLILFLKNMSHQKIYTFWYCVVNNEVPFSLFSNSRIIWGCSTSSFTRSIQAEWLRTKQQGDQKHSLIQKGSRKKENGFDIIYYIQYHTNWWIVFINSTRTFFICLKMYIMQCRKKIRVWDKIIKKEWISNILVIYYVLWDWHKIKKINKLNIVVWSCCSKRLLCGTHCFTISICDFVFQFNEIAN